MPSKFFEIFYAIFMESFKKNYITVQISQNSKNLLKKLEICYIIYLMLIMFYVLMGFLLVYLTNEKFIECKGEKNGSKK